MAKKNKKISLTKLSRLPSAVVNFTREARDELKKVSWPSRQTTLHYTIIVVMACLVTGFVIGGVDYLFSFTLERIIWVPKPTGMFCTPIPGMKTT